MTFTKKGICTRNDVAWPAADYDAIQFVDFSAVKVMGHTEPKYLQRLKQVRPNTITIHRLYDTDLQNRYFNQGKAP